MSSLRLTARRATLAVTVFIRGWILITLLQGCSTPSSRFDLAASEWGFQRERVMGAGYSHAVFSNHRPAGSHGILHVYLGGDGTPWIAGRWIAADPTPRTPLALDLMAKDGAPAIFLGRPCYQGMAEDSGCEVSLWTSARYSSQVVDSMAAALRYLLQRDSYSRLVLIGYSGGGALAMLLAHRFTETVAVITVAGNLDPDAWATLHGYRPLDDSLNPRDLPPLPDSVAQYHLVGELDRNTPAWLLEAALEKQPQAHIVVWKGFDHACCWEGIWQDVLSCVGEGRELVEE